MDPMSVIDTISETITVIASTNSFISGFTMPPPIVTDAKLYLSTAETSLAGIEETFKMLSRENEFRERYGPALNTREIKKLVQTTHDVCKDLNDLLANSTERSTNARFDQWDRVLVKFDEHRFQTLIQQLRGCLSTLETSSKTIECIQSVYMMELLAEQNSLARLPNEPTSFGTQGRDQSAQKVIY